MILFTSQLLQHLPWKIKPFYTAVTPCTGKTWPHPPLSYTSPVYFCTIANTQVHLLPPPPPPLLLITCISHPHSSLFKSSLWTTSDTLLPITSYSYQLSSFKSPHYRYTVGPTPIPFKVHLLNYMPTLPTLNILVYTTTPYPSPLSHSMIHSLVILYQLLVSPF